MLTWRRYLAAAPNIGMAFSMLSGISGGINTDDVCTMIFWRDGGFVSDDYEVLGDVCV